VVEPDSLSRERVEVGADYAPDAVAVEMAPDVVSRDDHDIVRLDR
jgi:hypothetical protein